MNTNPLQCSCCGKTICRDTAHRAFTRYHQELCQLLSQPEVDYQRLSFLVFLIGTLDKKFHVLQEIEDNHCGDGGTSSTWNPPVRMKT